MADLSALSTEELMRMRGASKGAPPPVDLSTVSTEDLMKMRAPPEPGLLEKAAGLGEAGLTLATGATGGLLGRVGGFLGGVAGSVASGQFGTAEGARQASLAADEGAAKLTYQPRTESGRERLGDVASFMDATKLAGLGPAEAVAANAVPVRQALGGVRPAAAAGAETVAGMLRREEPAMAGGGAAVADPGLVRRTRAADLPVPVKLSKGEATRDFEQQRFERETAKQGTPAGALLRAHGVEGNKNVMKNLEWFLDESGAQAPSARVVGNVVDDALRSRSDFMKAKYRDAYKRAEAAGETAALVDARPLLEYISANRSAEKLAPVISAIESEVVRLGGGAKTGQGIVFPEKMTINDLENVRKLALRLGKADETNGHYAGLANTVIDQMTDGQGGKLYAEARQLYKDHAGEFKNQGAIKKLLDKKPGTTDRSVAFEDVFKHSVLAGSMDDTQAIFRSLEQAGPKGKQAIAELKGETVKYLQDQASKNAGRDINGNPILSYAKLNNAVRELEIDGKLDFLFGKKGAQQIRDITEIVADLNVAPPGAVNSSTTSAVLMEALSAAMTGRLPTAVGRTVQGVKSAMGDYKDLKRVRDALTVH